MTLQARTSTGTWGASRKVVARTDDGHEVHGLRLLLQSTSYGMSDSGGSAVIDRAHTSLTSAITWMRVRVLVQVRVRVRVRGGGQG